MISVNQVFWGDPKSSTRTSGEGLSLRGFNELDRQEVHPLHYYRNHQS